MSKNRLLTIVVVTLAVAACGKKGPPRPPIPPIPVAGSPVDVRQAGEHVDLLVPLPQRMADGTPVQGFTGLKIYRLVRPLGAGEEEVPQVSQRDFPDSMEPVAILEEAQTAGLQPGGATSYQEALDDVLPDSGGSVAVFYAARFRAVKDRWSPPSPAGTVVLGPVVTRPSSLTAVSDPGGVRLTWSPAPETGGTALYRRIPPAPFSFRPRMTLPEGTETFVDVMALPGETYEYAIRGVVGEGARSRLSAMEGPVQVLVQDRFPPAVPRGLTVLARQGGVDLFWAPNDEHDLAGYHVYRREFPDGEWRRVTAQPISATAWTDSATAPGATYVYGVTALDVQLPANESQRSPSQQVDVPLPTTPESVPEGQEP